MRDRPLFLPLCLGILVVAALSFAVMPALLRHEDEAAAVRPVISESSGSVRNSAPNALQPSDGSAARPTAAFPAFNARGGGLYATEEEAP
ncbi:hypothetical protein M8R20_15510 [Pseudomonas sp. R2.Fl]|nr:hypothetical protein [Pseudomonas sp. R2.Fl]